MSTDRHNPAYFSNLSDPGTPSQVPVDHRQLPQPDLNEDPNNPYNAIPSCSTNSPNIRQATTIKRLGMPHHDGRIEMLQKNIANVFPLHLAPIDAFFCADDRAAYPMTSVIHLDFTGEILQDPFEAALDEALIRHPLLKALIRPAKRSMPCWVPATGIRPQVNWGDFNQPITCPNGEAIDLSREVGLRFWIRVGEGRTRVTVQVHHACTDGTGVYRFIGDLLAAYAIRSDSGTAPPEFGRIDTRLLRTRRRKMAGIAITGTASQFLRRGFQQAWDIFGKRVKVIDAPQPNGKPKTADNALTPFPGIFSIGFTREEHKQLRAAASSFGAMLNDLLLAEMFQTIKSWNERRGNKSHGCLRLMMPFDMRDKDDYEMPAANMTAYTFITRSTSDCADAKKLVSSVREETAQIKNGRLGSSFVDAIMLAENSPAVLSYLLNRNKCIASAILSNVGDPTKRFLAKLPREGGKVRCGNLILDDVTGVPPLRPNSHATLAIFSYMRRLTISVRCDPFRFTPSDCKEFLALYAQRLRLHLQPVLVAT